MADIKANMRDWLVRVGDRIRVKLDKKKPEQAVKVTPAQRKAYTLLFENMREHALIYVRPATSKKTYQSVILDVNPHEQYFLIDELFPSKGFELVVNDLLEVSIGQVGKSITFVTELQLMSEYAGTPFYKLALPEMIEQEQRRRSYRLEIEQNRCSYAQWAMPDGGQYRAKLLDISASGVRMAIQEGDIGLVSPGTILPSIMLYIGFELQLQCDIEIKYCVDEDGLILVGGQIISTEMNGQQLLQRYVHKIQRVNRRRQIASGY